MCDGAVVGGFICCHLVTLHKGELVMKMSPVMIGERLMALERVLRHASTVGSVSRKS